ncbi:NUDIX hydrolase, partial [Pseudomonas syringae]|nr:NUDIX hydrolase [Pseudomonas syringae]
VRHNPDYVLDDGIVGPVWLTRDELLAEQPRWRSELVMRCLDDYLNAEHFSLDLLRDKA